MASPNHYLVSFEEVSASIGSYNLSSIVELHLSAMANDIPQITLLVDAGNPNSKSSRVTDAVSIGRARDIIDKLRGQIKSDSATLSLSLTVRFSGESGEETQKLNINGWMLTDVGVSPIQESGVCTVSVTCMHPLCKANFGGDVPGLISVEPNLSSISGSDPLTIFNIALNKYLTAARTAQIRLSGSKVAPGSADPIAIRDGLVKQASNAGQALAKHLKWGGGSLPAASVTSSLMQKMIVRALADYALPNSGTSVYQRFAKCLVPECSLAIGGDYTGEQLNVGPFTPWKASGGTQIKEDNIISMAFPQSDPSPLSGVHMLANDTADGLSDSYHADSSQTNEKPADIFYVPQAELSKSYAYGPVYQIYEPGWLASAWAYARIAMSRKKSDILAAKEDDLYTGSNMDREQVVPLSTVAESPQPVKYSKAMTLCAKAYYETALMKDMSFSVTTRIMFNSGGVISPGLPLSVTCDSGEVLGGYIVGVTHTISVANRTAHTTITCTHPRFGEPPNGITGENALYS